MGSNQPINSLKHSFLGNISFSLAKFLGGSLVNNRLDLKKYIDISERYLPYSRVWTHRSSNYNPYTSESSHESFQNWFYKQSFNLD